MFETDSKDIERKCNSIFKEIKQKISLQYKQELLYGLLWKFPILYRIFRIHGDQTMLDWEKGKKREHELSEKSST
jgi:hypothetical protein